MSSRYDSRTTTFSPEGRLYQVEYAVEATSHAGTAIGILTDEGVVLAAEKRLQNPLLDVEPSLNPFINGDKLHTIDQHVGCAIAGITSDANTLVNFLRMEAHAQRYQYGSPILCEDLCRALCDVKQDKTQNGGKRPFGVSFLVAGWDRQNGYQLYHTDPSGNYTGWKAYAIGANDEAAMGLLKQEWKAGLSLQEGALLAAKVLCKTMDINSLTADRIEVATLTMVAPPAKLPKVFISTASQPLLQERVPYFSVMRPHALAPIIAEAERRRIAAEEEAKRKDAESALRL